MKKIYNLLTGEIYEYPRLDNEEVKGLDENLIAVEYEELPARPYNKETHKIIPRLDLDLSEKKVIRQWDIVLLTEADLTEKYAKMYKPVEMWQIRVWLARNNFNPSNMELIISNNIPDGPARWEALERWRTVTIVPINHPMVSMMWAVIKNSLGREISLEEGWLEIQKI